MAGLYLNAANDIELDSAGLLRVTSSTEDTVAQRISCRLQTFLGEHFLDRSLGVPYFQEVMKKNPDVGRVRSLLVSVVAGVEGVKQILEFNAVFDSAERTFKVNFKAMADDGTIVTGEL